MCKCLAFCIRLLPPQKICMSTVCVWGCAVCCGWGGQWSIFFPITLLHTCGSFTFMVIQIMKLSIQEILWWEQWTQLPPAACEMGWQTLRQMGEAAVGRQSNHIHLACFPFPLFMFSAATYQQAGAKEPEIITCTPTIRQTHTFTNTLPEVHSTPALFPPLLPTTNKHLRFPSSFTLIFFKTSHTFNYWRGEQKFFWGGGGLWGNICLHNVVPSGKPRSD